MNISIIGRATYPLVQRRATYLSEMGHQVHIISPDMAAIEGVMVHVAKPNALLSRVKGHYLGMLPQVRRWVREVGAEVVDIHGASSWGPYALYPKSEPRVITVYGPDIYSHAGSSLLIRQFVRIALSRADLVLGSTEIIRDYVSQHVGLDLGNKLRTHSFGIPLHDISQDAESRRTQVRAHYGVAASTCVILHSRHIAPLWRVDLLVEAFAQLLLSHADSELWLAYPEPSAEGKRLLATLQQRTSELGMASKVRWLGFSPYEQMISIMHASDVYVCIGEADLHASSIDEAICTELICVLSDLPSYRTVVKDEVNGLLLPTVTIESVREKLRYALDNYERLRAEMGSYNRLNVASTLDIAHGTRWVVDQYQDAISLWGRRSRRLA